MMNLVPDLEWKTVATEPNGLLDIARHAQRSPGGETDLIFARTQLTAEREEVRKFTFGYSDIVTVFLNGRIIFTGNSAYLSRDETFSGIVGLFDTVHLPLVAGDNELLFCVVENFGGWGLMGQDNSADYFASGVEPVWSMPTGKPRSRIGPVRPGAESDLCDPVFRRRQGVHLALEPGRRGSGSRSGCPGCSAQRGCACMAAACGRWTGKHLIEIDPDEGVIIEKHLLPDPAFPNDVAFDAAGDGYVTDTQAHRIYRCDGDTCLVWHEGDSIVQPNGLLIDGDRLLYGNQGDGCLKAVSLDDRSSDGHRLLRRRYQRGRHSARRPRRLDRFGFQRAYIQPRPGW